MFKNRNIIIFWLAYSSMLCMGFIPSNGPIRYFRKVKGWLTLYTKPADWLTARINCHMDGGFLASPWSPEFTEAVLYAVATDQTDEKQIPVLFSGVHTSFAEGALTNGKGIFVLSLKPGDLAALERCGVFFANGTTGEVDCRQRLPYVCYSPDYVAQSELEVTTEVEPDSTSATRSTTDELDSSTIGGWAKTDSETTTDQQDSSPIIGRATTDSTITKWGTTDSELESASSLTLKSTCGEESLGYEYSEKTRRCYKFHANAVHTWENARSACEAEGAQLAIVNSDEEAQVLSNLFAKYPREDISGATFLDTAAIGFLKESIWETIDGDSLEKAGYEKWRPNAPHPAARYGYICRDGLLYGYMSDIKDVPYICEKQPSETDTQQGFQKVEQESEQKLELLQFDCGDESLGYEFENITGQCYKFHTQVASNWNAAKTACEGEGAHLAIVNSDDETQVLVKLFAKYIPEKIPGLINIAAISFPRANAVNPWLINHGETLDEAGYDLSYPHAKEGYFTSHGNLLPYNAYVKDIPFICEKKPVERKPDPEGNIEPEVSHETNIETEQITARSFYESTPESGTTELTNVPRSLKDVDQIILNFQRFLAEQSLKNSKESITETNKQEQIQRTIEEETSQTIEDSKSTTRQPYNEYDGYDVDPSDYDPYPERNLLDYYK